jgi:hypothetical protein
MTENRPGRRLTVPLLLSLALFATGCSTIPPETVALSELVGTRIQSANAAHLTLVRAYMDDRRARVEAFLMDEWLPRFAREYLGQPEIAAMYDRVCRDGSAEDRLQLSLIIATDTQTELQARRRDYIGGLDRAQRALERQIRDFTDQTLVMNRALTAHLQSLVDVQAQQDRWLEQVGTSRTDINQQLEAVGAAVDRLTEPLNRAEELAGRFEDFRAAMAPSPGGGP